MALSLLSVKTISSISPLRFPALLCPSLKSTNGTVGRGKVGGSGGGAGSSTLNVPRNGKRGSNHMIKHSKHWSLQPSSRSPEQLDKYESGERGKDKEKRGENNREKESLWRLDHSCCVLSARWIRGSISLSLSCRASLFSQVGHPMLVCSRLEDYERVLNVSTSSFVQGHPCGLLEFV